MAKDKAQEDCTNAFMKSGLLRAMYQHHSGGVMDATQAGHPLSKDKPEKDAEPLSRDLSDYELEMLFREEVAKALKTAGFTRDNGKKAQLDDDNSWEKVYALHGHMLHGTELMKLATEDKLSPLLSSTDHGRQWMLEQAAKALGLTQQNIELEGMDHEMPEPVVTTPTLFRGVDPERMANSGQDAPSDQDFARFIVKLQRQLTHVDGSDNKPTAKMSDAETQKYYIETVKAALERVMFPASADIEPGQEKIAAGTRGARFDMSTLKEDWFKTITGPAFTSRNPLLEKDTVNTNLGYLITVENYKHSKAISHPHNPAAESRIQAYAEELGQAMLDHGLIKEQDPTIRRLPSGRARPRKHGQDAGPDDDGKGSGGRGV